MHAERASLHEEYIYIYIYYSCPLAFAKMAAGGKSLEMMYGRQSQRRHSSFEGKT